MVHGLPGSRKSKLLLWLRTYFEEVWKWTDGVQFQYLAPLNSMANNIGGSTMHTWAGLKFTNSEGEQISGNNLRKGKDNVSQRHRMCDKLRFLFIYEMGFGGAVYCIDSMFLELLLFIFRRSPI